MIQPIKTKVLVECDGKKTETASGLYTGNYSVEGEMRRGTVKAVGSSVRSLKEGDRVLFQVFVGSIVKYDGQEYYLLETEEVLAILEEE